MDDHSDGPTGLLFIAIGALVVAVGLLVYFVLDGRDTYGGAAVRGVSFDMPAAMPSQR